MAKRQPAGAASAAPAPAPAPTEAPVMEQASAPVPEMENTADEQTTQEAAESAEKVVAAPKAVKAEKVAVKEDKMIQIKATAKGFSGNVRRSVGEKFYVKESRFSTNWMEKI